MWTTQHSYILCHEELDQCRSRIQLFSNVVIGATPGTQLVEPDNLDELLHEEEVSVVVLRQKYTSRCMFAASVEAVSHSCISSSRRRRRTWTSPRTPAVSATEQ